jgi:hypothetical protein
MNFLKLFERKYNTPVSGFLQKGPYEKSSACYADLPEAK